MPKVCVNRRISPSRGCGERPRYWRPVAAAHATSLIHLSSVAGPGGRLTLSMSSHTVIELVLFRLRQRLPSVAEGTAAVTSTNSLKHNRACAAVRQYPISRCGLPGYSRLRQEAECYEALGRSVTTPSPVQPVDSLGMVPPLPPTPYRLDTSNLDGGTMKVRARLSCSVAQAQGLLSLSVPSDSGTPELQFGNRAQAARNRVSANRAGV